MDRTAVRSRVGLTQGAVRIPAAAPLDRDRVRFRTLLFRYLAVGFILLATVVVANPGAPTAPGDPDPWDYQREQVDVQGRGVLNAYGRMSIRATAWLAKSSIERQRDMLRLSLFDALVGPGAAQSVGGWRARNAHLLEAATKAALLGLIAWGVIRRPAWRNLTVAALLLIVATVTITRPYSTVSAATRPGVVVPNAMLTMVTRIAPDGAAGDQADAEPTQRRLLTGYWRSFVAHPLSRMQTGTTVLAEAEPGKKASVLDALRRNVSAVNDWAVGHRGPERAFMATSALGYVLPFAVGLGALAMVAACAQTILFLLCLAGPFVLPVAVAGRRHRRALVRFWLAPLLGSVAVLAAASLLSFVVVRAAETLHASDEYVGLLQAGSTWPALAAFLIGRWLTHRRQGLGLSPVGPADAANAPRS
ncbi:MAG TPA: hypothetical protein VFJ69_01285 [Actinomycetota bacterium]|nr:hypothetical protein [Actinomycetota bacterium]